MIKLTAPDNIHDQASYWVMGKEVTIDPIQGAAGVNIAPVALYTSDEDDGSYKRRAAVHVFDLANHYSSDVRVAVEMIADRYSLDYIRVGLFEHNPIGMARMSRKKKTEWSICIGYPCRNELNQVFWRKAMKLKDLEKLVPFLEKEVAKYAVWPKGDEFEKNHKEMVVRRCLMIIHKAVKQILTDNGRSDIVSKMN